MSDPCTKPDCAWCRFYAEQAASLALYDEIVADAWRTIAADEERAIGGWEDDGGPRGTYVGISP
jgi:hypothetical protein